MLAHSGVSRALLEVPESSVDLGAEEGLLLELVYIEHEVDTIGISLQETVSEGSAFRVYQGYAPISAGVSGRTPNALGLPITAELAMIKAFCFF